MNDGVICEKCRFWVTEDEVGGDCRRYPPTPVYRSDEGAVSYEWSWTVSDEWCGEFKAKTRLLAIELGLGPNG